MLPSFFSFPNTNGSIKFVAFCLFIIRTKPKTEFAVSIGLLNRYIHIYIQICKCIQPNPVIDTNSKQNKLLTNSKVSFHITYNAFHRPSATSKVGIQNTVLSTSSRFKRLNTMIIVCERRFVFDQTPLKCL